MVDHSSGACVELSLIQTSGFVNCIIFYFLFKDYTVSILLDYYDMNVCYSSDSNETGQGECLDLSAWKFNLNSLEKKMKEANFIL